MMSSLLQNAYSAVNAKIERFTVETQGNTEGEPMIVLAYSARQRLRFAFASVVILINNDLDKEKIPWATC